MATSGEIVEGISCQEPVQIVGKVSPWIRPDSENQMLRKDSEAALRQELEWAGHLALNACILPIPPSLQNSNYARILNQVCTLSSLKIGNAAICTEAGLQHLHFQV